MHAVTNPKGRANVAPTYLSSPFAAPPAPGPSSGVYTPQRREHLFSRREHRLRVHMNASVYAAPGRRRGMHPEINRLAMIYI